MEWRKGGLSGKDRIDHKAIVEKTTDSDTIYISKSVYGSFKFANIISKKYTGNLGMDNSNDFRGCIFNPNIYIN